MAALDTSFTNISRPVKFHTSRPRWRRKAYQNFIDFENLDWSKVNKVEDIDTFGQSLDYLTPEAYCYLIPRILGLVLEYGMPMVETYLINNFLNFANGSNFERKIEALNIHQRIAFWNANCYIAENIIKMSSDPWWIEHKKVNKMCILGGDLEPHL